MLRIPPTREALFQHALRAAYQAGIWSRSHLSVQNCPSPGGWGWTDEDHRFRLVEPSSCIGILWRVHQMWAACWGGVIPNDVNVIKMTCLARTFASARVSPSKTEFNSSFFFFFF
eukprot:Lithocolla_globosa_v1_NODE_6546_length_1070_cov_21.340887.p1 type:complete len:115 gc:universal NODE_6546_length_1070_cov_21.340887:215-559(+)